MDQFEPNARWLVSPAPRRRSLINLTPLIDVVFILLIFFMLASSFLDWRSIDLAAPGQAAAQPSGLEQSLLIEVRRDDMRFAGSTVTLAQIGERLRPRLAENPKTHVFVRPDDGIPLQRTINVLDGLTAMGAANVSLIKGPKR